MPKSKNIQNLFKDKDWHKFKNKPIFPIGFENKNDNKIVDLSNVLSHLLIGGKPSSEKINFFHSTIITLLKNSKEETLKLILLGNKKSKLALYRKLKNRLLFPFVPNPDCAKISIQWCLSEVDRRFQLFTIEKGKTFDEYNKSLKEKLPRIVIIIEDLNKLMENNQAFYKKTFEGFLDLSYLVNVHFIIGTSRPSDSKVMSKKIIEKFIHRITFATETIKDSLAMIGNKEAKGLNGNENLSNFSVSKNEPRRCKTFSVDKRDIENAINIK